MRSTLSEITIHSNTVKYMFTITEETESQTMMLFKQMLNHIMYYLFWLSQIIKHKQRKDRVMQFDFIISFNVL